MDGSAIVYVYTLNGGKGKWSRYLFPFAADAFAQLGNDLYDHALGAERALAHAEAAGLA